MAILYPLKSCNPLLKTQKPLCIWKKDYTFKRLCQVSLKEWGYVRHPQYNSVACKLEYCISESSQINAHQNQTKCLMLWIELSKNVCKRASIQANANRWCIKCSWNLPPHNECECRNAMFLSYFYLRQTDIACFPSSRVNFKSLSEKKAPSNQNPYLFAN